MFHVGQEVVYIGRGVRIPGKGNGNEILPVPGQKYTIRGFREHAFAPSIILEEIINPPQLYNCGDGAARILEFGFWLSSFRPIVKTDISIFQAMLAPTPKRELVE